MVGLDMHIIRVFHVTAFWQCIIHVLGFDHRWVELFNLSLDGMPRILSLPQLV